MHNQRPTLQTQRLTLRQWTTADIEPMSAINADPEVMRWIGDGSTRSLDQTRQFIHRCEVSWDERGFGLFAVELRESAQLMGFTGLSVPNFLPEVMPAVEIGWRFAENFWGRGFATEAATAALNYGFKDRGLEEVLSICQVGNGASERVMKKIGMTLQRATVDPSCGRPVRIYAAARP